MTKVDQRLEALHAAIDGYGPAFEKLRRASNLAEYLDAKGDRADEEILTEPIMRSVIELVLGFPKGRYFEQLGRSGRKPDFTPEDLLAHPFVLDAKSSDEVLARHEKQIRGYMDQRRLRWGVLFNLREVAVFRRGATGLERDLSFPVLPLWQVARGEAIAGEEVERFEAFCDAFAYRDVSVADKIRYIAEQEAWPTRFHRNESFVVDVEALVERLRRLSDRLAEDAAGQVEALDTYVSFDEQRRDELLEELRLLALDIAPGVDDARLPATLADWRAGSEPLTAAVWKQYTVRVAYLALARILLYRAWEDVEFVTSYLHDGGFGQWYDQLGKRVDEVLREAFLHGRERYPWLFGRENNYDWYHPSDDVLVDVLYALAPEPLGKLDADVLGSLYATYVEAIDRDRLGQFFTPREVVRFMLDQAGFVGGGVFRIEGDERKPVAILDFATGSGGFLVEAAHRMIDAVDPAKADAQALTEALRAIVHGIAGGEISPFPYYLTEINLLLQLSRLLGPLRAVQHGAVPSFGALGVLPIDTLTAKSASATSLEIEPEQRADHSELVADDRFGLVPLDGAKRDIYRDRLKPDGGFDLVVGNPPYVSEANNKPLFDRLRAIPAWRGIYRGKTDYLYYFLLLALEKVKPGGTLCVITPAGWMNAGAADFLRKRLSEELTLERLFLFGSYKLFATTDAAPTPTVESAILVARKAPPSKGHKLRVVALEAESKADRHDLLDEMATRADGRAGRRKGIHVHDVTQASLAAERPWPVKFGAKDVPTLVVAHLQAQLDEDRCEPLEKSWKVFQGIQTAADAYTKRIDKRLSAKDRAALASRGVRIGDPILERRTDEAAEEPWSSHPEVLVRNPEAASILYGAIDEGDATWLVVIRGDPPAPVLAELERYRSLLATRAEIARNARRRWWEAAWPRAAKDMTAPKVIALYRTDRGRFALDETGEWQPSIKSTLVVGRERDAPVAYLCGLLNSELLDLWYAVRGKVPRDVWRNYEPKRMNEMPYSLPEGDPRADEVAQLVRNIAANRRELLPHRPVVHDLDQIVKDPWRRGPVDVDVAAMLGELSKRETVSLRLDPALTVELHEPAPARVHRVTRTVVELRRGTRVTGRITGETKRLDLLELVLGGKADERVGETLLPQDVAAFEAAVEARRRTVQDLLDEGRELVERVERLVCALYDVPDDLAERVVEHAVGRAR